MKGRNAIFALLAALLTCGSYGDYTARLWFRNVTTGAENTGAVLVSPGDIVDIRFVFHQTTEQRPVKWSVLQMAIDLSNQSILPDFAANTWESTVSSAFQPSTAFIVKNFWQPNSGPMYDQGVDPSDRKRTPLATAKGLYAIVGVSGARPQSHNYEAVVFRFRVAPNAARGSELHWMFETRPAKAGVGTRLQDDKSRSVQITDNWLRVR